MITAFFSILSLFVAIGNYELDVDGYSEDLFRMRDQELATETKRFNSDR